ncbi:MAG: hypothetical protein ABIF10_07295 [Candidatus Woesearchaeota archaeon]
MKGADYQILAIMKKDAERQYSTSEIVKLTEPEEWQKAMNLINNDFNDRKASSDGKRVLAQLHRKWLYYLNKLVKEQILRVSYVGNKGEKSYSLNIAEGEDLILERSHKKIIITRPRQPAMPTEGYEQKGIIYKYDEQNWISRVNSILVESTGFEDITGIYTFVTKCFNSVNDAIGIANCEAVFQQHKDKSVEAFLQSLGLACEDYGRETTLIFDVDSIKDEEKILKLISHAQGTHSRLHYIWEITNRSLEEKKIFFKQLIEILSRAKVRLNIKNKGLWRPPYILGKAGPYTFNQQDWRAYIKELRNTNTSIVCAQSTVALDIQRCLTEKRGLEDFTSLILKASRTLLAANAIQRNNFKDYFGNIWKSNASAEIMSYSRNYIRFWNYGWKDEQAGLPIERIASSKEGVSRFCASQYIIYQACGMPTRFEIAFAPAFKGFHTGMSEERFQRLVIAKASDFHDEKMRKTLHAKEKLFQIFDGGDRARFFHSGTFDSEEIVRELGIILSTYKFPLFSYDFSQVPGSNLKLDSFF